jgi:hypothetical protein
VRRRTLLLGGGASVLLAGGGGAWWHERGNPSYHVPGGTHPQTRRGAFASAAMQTRVGWSVVYPSRPGPMPLLVYLHGRSGHHRDIDRYGPFLYDYVRKGGTPFAMVGVDGGDHTYYHRRASGQDPQRMIVDELLPVLASRGLLTARFALGGVSMGGYGALLLSEALGAKRVAACVVDSPAIFAGPNARSKGSFDSDADFRAHDVVAGSPGLAGVPLRVTCGTSDPFLPGVKRLLAKLPAATHDISKGGHNAAFWLHTAPAQVAFAGRHLA